MSIGDLAMMQKIEMMRALMTAVLASACGGARMYTVHLVNETDRPVEAVYFYKLGAEDHGASRGTLAAHGEAQVQVRGGNVEVLAVSAKVQVGEHTRERRSATGTIELKGPVDVVFYDEGHRPPLVARPDVIGVEFVPDKTPVPEAPTRPIE